MARLAHAALRRVVDAATSILDPDVVVEGAAPAANLDELFPDERRYVEEGPFAPARQREFAAARGCARRALRRLGALPCALVPRADRSPRWPDGIAGSITHTRELCLVALARRGRVASLGVDVEHVTAAGADIEALVCTAAERRWLDAVNPVPRRNITEMVEEELALAPPGASGARGAIVTLSVPGGEEMARQTLNGRLGLVGGISILGTSGIVRPYSTAAFKASIVQSIDVARERGHRTLVVTTGGKSEAYAMKLHPELAEEAFIQMGDFVGATLKHCARRKIERVLITGMIGKLSKMANGKMQTHAAGQLHIEAELVDFSGALLGRYPMAADPSP